MKPRESLVRLKTFQVKEKRRQRDQLANMIEEFARMGGDLDAQIEAEERRAGITDPTHFAYPMPAKAARTRRENLSNSAKELKVQLDAANIALEEAEAELEKAEAKERRDGRVAPREAEPVRSSAMIG